MGEGGTGCAETIGTADCSAIACCSAIARSIDGVGMRRRADETRLRGIAVCLRGADGIRVGAVTV